MIKQFIVPMFLHNDVKTNIVVIVSYCIAIYLQIDEVRDYLVILM